MRNAAWTYDITDPSQITSYMAYYPLIESLHSGWNVDEVNQLFEQRGLRGAKVAAPDRPERPGRHTVAK